MSGFMNSCHPQNNPRKFPYANIKISLYFPAKYFDKQFNPCRTEPILKREILVLPVVPKISAVNQYPSRTRDGVTTLYQINQIG
jgi:hypothetical protein